MTYGLKTMEHYLLAAFLQQQKYHKSNVVTNVEVTLLFKRCLNVLLPFPVSFTMPIISNNFSRFVFQVNFFSFFDFFFLFFNVNARKVYYTKCTIQFYLQFLD